jgi:hypothetical protein
LGIGGAMSFRIRLWSSNSHIRITSSLAGTGGGE